MSSIDDVDGAGLGAANKGASESRSEKYARSFARSGGDSVDADLSVNKTALFWRLVGYTVLTFLTFGIYRFWAKTKLRRLLWSKTTIGDDPFEYHGTAGELFIGFLIAIACLAPFYIAFNFATVILMDPQSPFSSSALVVLAISYLGFYVLFIFASYRIFRYRLTRTSWRSVRMGATGTATSYSLLAIKWDIATLLTLGVAYPYARHAKMTYFFNSATFGEAAVLTDCSKQEFAKIWRLPAILFYGAALVSGFVVYELIEPFVLLLSHSPSNSADFTAEKLVPFLILFLLSTLVISVSSILYFSRETQLLFDGLKIGANVSNNSKCATLECSLKSSVIIKIHLKFFIIMVAFMGFTVAVSQLIPFVAALMLFVFVLTSSALAWVLINLPIYTEIVRSISVRNLKNLEEVWSRDRSKDPKYGEGLADALDVGAI